MSMANPTIGTALVRMRERITDTDNAFQDPELISYIADVIRLLSTTLIIARDPVMKESANLSPGGNVPANFVAWAGKYPVRNNGDGTVSFLEPLILLDVNYWEEKVLPSMTDINAELPFPSLYLSAIVYGACALAFIRNEGTAMEEQAIVDKMLGLISQAKKGGQ